MGAPSLKPENTKAQVECIHCNAGFAKSMRQNEIKILAACLHLQVPSCDPQERSILQSEDQTRNTLLKHQISGFLDGFPADLFWSFPFKTR
ncbi:hypothetical protein [Deinococcus misasensis]|uniref:hypothetical protein n=1 Tax=Deinococcus misasensis TaxID=392413 RepID=UPI0012F879C5|nr:hypothetical protein [Deinococcus misasensis]